MIMQGKKILLNFFLVVFLIAPDLASAKMPNDPSAAQWAYEHIGLYQTWNYTVGSKDVVVAVIDTGFDTFHPDLLDNVWKNEDEVANNKIDDDDNGYVDDVWGWNFVAEDVNGDGKVDAKEQLGNNNPRPNVTKLSANEKEEEIFSHGTMVAGLIGARGDNKRDGVGVNWRVKLMNIKVIDNTGTGTLNELPRAIRYAVDNGADIINISLVSSDYSPEIDDAVQYAYKKNAAVFAAAGNNSSHLNFSPSYPICSDASSTVEMVLGVSAITEDHHITRFSNIGSNCIDITAPGQHVSSTVRYSPINGLKDSYAGGLNGTSFATPLAAGAAALIKGLQPNWGPDKIFAALLRTVHHTPGQDELVYANLFGAGLLQVDKAIKYVLEQLGPIHLASTLLVLGLDSGKVGGWNWSDDVVVDVNKLLVKVDDWAVYKDGGEQSFFTVKQVNSKASQVTIYNDGWKKKKSWSIASDGKLNIAVGDIVGDEEAEIVLSPQYASDWLWRVYDQSGKKQNERLSTAKHQGVSVGLSPKVGETKAKMAALYQSNGDLKLVSFGDDLQEAETFKVGALQSRGELAIGDVDGDGKVEYILSGIGGDGSYVALYNSDGKYKRRFKLSDSQDLFDVRLGDYNKDGKDEIFTAPLSGGSSALVWTYRGKKLFEWSPPFASAGLKLLVY
ncbi:MAG: S8 family serine peptidase [Candidatus Magasanikbacteria bacterium]|nr:S8 family serine peptidase [Candidatus Magasanikbacteria bacterium]